MKHRKVQPQSSHRTRDPLYVGCWTCKPRARFAPRGRTGKSPRAKGWCSSQIYQAEGVKSHVRTDAAILARESPQDPRCQVGKNQKTQELRPTGTDLEMDFQRQIEIELFEIRRSYLRDPGLVVGSIARVLLQGMNLALHSRHLVI
jgi:hypothetical protein